MPAYLLLAFALLTRLVPHPAWLNFTAVGGSLLYFGARRNWREMLAPMVAFMAADYLLTVYSYHYAFTAVDYIPTWSWYLAAMVLGRILLASRTTWLRAGSAALLGPTSFFVLSNFAVWVTGTMYPHTLAGLAACYEAAIPFYRNDLVSTTIVVAAAFGLPVLVRRMRPVPAVAVR